MRLLTPVAILIAAHVGMAAADAPQGRYRLDPRARTEMHGPRGVHPSCGKQADAFVANARRVGIEYRRTVKVNGDTWDIDSIEKDQVVAMDRTTMRPLVITVIFGRTSKTAANGVLSVVELDDNGQVRYADSVLLKGTFAP
jgi:hypothetical protein